MSDKCKACSGEAWVCEDHPEKPWQDGDCCGAAGAACPTCNEDGSKLPEGMEVIWKSDAGYLS